MGTRRKITLLHALTFFSSPTLFWDLLMEGVLVTISYKTNCKGWPSALAIDPNKGSRGEF
jgi:hypothetical protein